MRALVLPALDGRRSLGFLAALGTLRLLADDDVDHADTRLSWDPRSCTAILHDDTLPDLDTLVSQLHRIATRQPPTHLLPGVDLPLPPYTPNTDALRKPIDHWAGWTQNLREQVTSSGCYLDRWLAALATDLVVDDDKNKGRLVTRTPYLAPFARQTSFSAFDKVTALVRADPEWLTQAFRGWQRTDQCTGEYLDDLALRDAVDDAAGGAEAAERGVPGATWLALMALPLLPVTVEGTRVSAIGWQDHGQVLRWPLWMSPLDRDAVAALLTHPAIGLGPRAGNPSQVAPTRPTDLLALGVFQISAARRRVIRLGTQRKRVLVPYPVHTDGG